MYYRESVGQIYPLHLCIQNSQRQCQICVVLSNVLNEPLDVYVEGLIAPQLLVIYSSLIKLCIDHRKHLSAMYNNSTGHKVSRIINKKPSSKQFCNILCRMKQQSCLILRTKALIYTVAVVRIARYFGAQHEPYLQC